MTRADVHVLPVADLREHEHTRECWCEPALQEIQGRVVVVHQAMDGRELVERHGLQ